MSYSAHIRLSPNLNLVKKWTGVFEIDSSDFSLSLRKKLNKLRTDLDKKDLDELGVYLKNKSIEYTQG